MKKLDYFGLTLICLTGAASLSKLYHPEAQDTLFTLCLLFIALLAERSAAGFSQSARQDSKGITDQASLLRSLVSSVRENSLLLSVYIPAAAPPNWKSIESFPAPKRLRQCISQPASLTWILFLSFIFFTWIDPPGQALGLFSRLLQGSEFGLLLSIAIASFLAWWSLSFFLFRFGLFWSFK